MDLACCYCATVATGLGSADVSRVCYYNIFLNKEIQFIESDDGARLSAQLLDVGPTHACMPPLSSAPTTTVHLRHQLRPPDTGAPTPARVHRLPNHHRDCCLDVHTTSPTCLRSHLHTRTRTSVYSKQLRALWFLSRSVPTLEGEVILNQQEHSNRP
jgi:hypothetical protein